jgi:hypothetical protein
MLRDIPWFVEVDGPKKLRSGKPKFSGALRDPIVESPSEQPVVNGRRQLEGMLESIWNQRIEKLILLAKHYELEDFEDPWLLLSLRLACTFVPGFRVTRERGRRKGATKWTAEEKDELIAAVRAVQSEQKGRTIAKSIELLQRRDSRWRSANEPRYYEAVRARELRGAVATGDYAGLLKKRSRLSS